MPHRADVRPHASGPAPMYVSFSGRPHTDRVTHASLRVTVPSEIRLLKREYFNRWYGLTSYFLAMSFSRLPAQIIFSSVYVLIVYVLTDQPLDTQRCLMFLGICIIIGFISESLGLVLSSFLNVVVRKFSPRTGPKCNDRILKRNSFQNGIFMGPAISVPLMLLAVYGLGDGAPQVPLYMKLFMYLSYLRYGLEGLVLTLYGGNRANMVCPEEEVYCHYRNPKTIIQIAGMEHANFWVRERNLSTGELSRNPFRINCFLPCRWTWSLWL